MLVKPRGLFSVILPLGLRLRTQHFIFFPTKSVRIPILNKMLVPLSLELKLILQIRFIQSYQHLQEILFTKIKSRFLGCDTM